jgi:hypothetical protein
MAKKDKSFYLLNDPCFECHTEYVHVLPSYGDCQNCLRMRMEFLDRKQDQQREAQQ